MESLSVATDFLDWLNQGEKFLRNRRVQASFSKLQSISQNDPKQPAHREYPPSKVLFFDRLPRGCTSKTMLTMLADFKGAPKEATVFEGAGGIVQGFAEFLSQDAATEALNWIHDPANAGHLFILDEPVRAQSVAYSKRQYIGDRGFKGARSENWNRGYKGGYDSTSRHYDDRRYESRGYDRREPRGYGSVPASYERYPDRDYRDDRGPRGGYSQPYDRDPYRSQGPPPAFRRDDRGNYPAIPSGHDRYPEQDYHDERGPRAGYHQPYDRDPYRSHEPPTSYRRDERGYGYGAPVDSRGRSRSPRGYGRGGASSNGYGRYDDRYIGR